MFQECALKASQNEDRGARDVSGMCPQSQSLLSQRPVTKRLRAGADALFGQATTPFERIRFAYRAASPVATIANASRARA